MLPNKKTQDLIKEKKKLIRQGLKNDQICEETIGEKLFRDNFENWERGISNGLGSRKYKKELGPGFTSFDMDDEINEGYCMKTGNFKGKNREDPWLESVQESSLLNKKRKNPDDESLKNSENDEEKSETSKNNKDKEDTKSEHYYGEENLFFSLDENLSHDEVREKQVQIFKLRALAQNYLMEGETISKCLIRLSKSQTNNSSSVSTLFNGKKIRKKNNQKESNLIKDNNQSNDLNQSVTDYKNLVDTVSKLISYGDNEIYNESLESLNKWIETEKLTEKLCSYRILNKNNPNEVVKTYLDLDSSKIKEWVDKKMLISDEEYNIEYSYDKKIWFKESQLLCK